MPAMLLGISSLHLSLVLIKDEIFPTSLRRMDTSEEEASFFLLNYHNLT